MKSKIIIITTVFLMFFNSCSENNQSINKETEKYHTLPNSEIEQLNETIKSKNLNSEEDIMAFYRPKEAFEEGNYSYTMQSKKIDEFTKEITLVEEGLLDDSQAGQKTIMLIKKENNVFTIISIKEQYKCWKGRGNENWSNEFCI